MEMEERQSWAKDPPYWGWVGKARVFVRGESLRPVSQRPVIEEMDALLFKDPCGRQARSPRHSL